MNKVRILVVDDAAFIRDLVKKGLRSHFSNIEVEEATNGRRAQQILAAAPVELILCDWEMPEMSGIELLGWCRAQASLKKVPFVMVTSRSDKENVIQAIQAGVTDYLGKPFTNEQLVNKVRKVMDRTGHLEQMYRAYSGSAGGLPNDSLAALTSGPARSVPAAAPAARTAAPAATPRPAAARAGSGPAGRFAGQLRLAAGNLECQIRNLSLKEAVLLVHRDQLLPQIMESAVLDLEQEQHPEVARLNGYLHALAAVDPRPDSEWLQLTFRFVDADPKKLDYLSRLIAAGTPQKHYVPGA